MNEKSLMTDGYWVRFKELTQSCATFREAYIQLEAEVEEKHGVNRYSTYESFRARRCQLKAHKTKGFTHYEYP